MKKHTLLLFFICALTRLFAQDTFSIVAVDSATGQIGSAGASCIDNSQISGGVVIISDIIPGRGAVNTQSFYIYPNQANAHDRMEEGYSPDSIISWLIQNDAQSNPEVRQYGVVDFDSSGRPRSAGFTGVNCYDYKNHITGKNYSIQGNILLGQQILDSMESRFLNTQGTLADKLMAALQGANVPGADTRCLADSLSSLSSFLRVAKPGDDPSALYLELIVPSSDGKEPIDSLQTLYDQWKAATGISVRQPELNAVIFPNPVNGKSRIMLDKSTSGTASVFDRLGRINLKIPFNNTNSVEIYGDMLVPGIYFYQVEANGKRTQGTFFVE